MKYKDYLLALIILINLEKRTCISSKVMFIYESAAAATQY